MITTYIPVIITLDENHVYTVNGEVKPGTTGILDYNGLISDFCKQEFAAQRGEAIHQGAALLFQDMLDWQTVDPRIMPYLVSLQLFIKTTGFTAVTVEQKGYSPLGFCGRWDVTGLFPDSPDDITIDLKSGSPAKWHKAQTAAYQQLARTKRRACLYLMADGTLPKFAEHTDPNDWKAFYSCLKIHQGEQLLLPYRENLSRWIETAH